MNLIDYGSILIRRGWIMLLLGIIAAGAAFIFSRQMTPVYRATQKVLIVPSRSDFGSDPSRQADTQQPCRLSR